jgi:hypothetical protein
MVEISVDLGDSGRHHRRGQRQGRQRGTPLAVKDLGCLLPAGNDKTLLNPTTVLPTIPNLSVAAAAAAGEEKMICLPSWTGAPRRNPGAAPQIGVSSPAPPTQCSTDPLPLPSGG